MRILGLELGSWSIKAVEMESRFRRMDILELHEVRLQTTGSDPTQNYKLAIEQLVARLPNHPEKIVTSLPAAQTALRFLQLPLKQRKRVEQNYRFELEDNVPFKLDDAIVEHHISAIKDGSLVFAAIAPKKNILSYLEWLKLVNLDPDWLTFEGMGVLNLYLSSLAEKDAEKPTGAVLLLDVGHQKTNLSVVRGDQLSFFRTLNWGGLAITQAIGMGLGISLEAAEKQKHEVVSLLETTEGTPPENEDLNNLALQSTSPLITDLSHTMVAFRSQYKEEVQSLVITGGTAKLKGIDSFLNRALGLPVKAFRPFKELDFTKQIEPSQEMRFGEPLGRALVFNRKSQLLFNFRKLDMGKATSFNEVGTLLKNPGAILLLKYTALLAVILFIHSIVAGILAESDSKKVTEDLRKVFSETFRSVPAKARNALTSNPEDLKKFIDKKEKDLSHRLALLSKGRTTKLSLLRSLSEAFPPETQVDVNVINLGDKTFQMDGVLYKGTLDKVTDALKKIAIFNNVKLSQDGQRFSYTGEVIGR